MLESLVLRRNWNHSQENAGSFPLSVSNCLSVGELYLVAALLQRFCWPYYGFPEHRSDPSVGQSHILARKRDGVTRELEKWSALIGSDTFCPIEGSDRCSGKP